MLLEAGITVLVVDDHAEDRQLLRLTLERQGATVLEARNGREGLELARKHRPDLIISDALMPLMDGFQLLYRLKTGRELGGIPFVFYSAVYSGLKEEELALALGAEAFIRRPKEPGEFLRELVAILKNLPTERRTPPAPSLHENEREYLRRYSSVVAAELENKVRELEAALARSREAEQALHSQFTQFSTIFDALNALVYVADMENGEILFMNRYGSLLFGNDWQGKSCAEVFQMPGREFCDWATAPKQKRDGIRERPYVREVLNPVNGRWYQEINRAIPWTDGRLVRLQIAFDITERKELERIRDEMISAVSHEMRTPLTALLGYAEYMLTDDLPRAEILKYLRVVQSEAIKLNKLIDTFLDIQAQRTARSSAGFREVPIRPLLEAAVALFAPVSPKHRFLLDCPDELPPVRGEEVLLGRVIEMLVSNAVKFSPDGGEVQLGAAATAGRVTLRVRDQGIGIPAEELEHIFEPFHRLDSSDRAPFGGTGLGLALAREIVLSHGGRVWAESRPGQGSVFYVSLPVYDQEEARR